MRAALLLSYATYTYILARVVLSVGALQPLLQEHVDCARVAEVCASRASTMVRVVLAALILALAQLAATRSNNLISITEDNWRQILKDEWMIEL